MPGESEVPQAATGVLVEQEARQPPLVRIPMLSAVLVEPEDSAGHKASVEMGVQAVPRMP